MGGAVTTGLAEFLVDQLNTSGGGSVNWYGYSPDSGYMVGGVVVEDVYDSLNTNRQAEAEVIQRFMSEHEDMLQNPSYFVGVWYDDETGCVHVDMSERFEDTWSAAIAARAKGEIAYYDLNNKRNVRTADLFF